MQTFRVSTLASAVGADSQSGTPEELHIVDPRPKPPPRSHKWLLDPGAAASSPPSASDTPATIASRRRQAALKASNALGEKFPTHEEIALLPAEIQHTLRELVLDYFRRKIYPRLLYLSRNKHRRNAVATALNNGAAPPITPQFLLQNTTMFARWPGLENVIRSLSLLVLDRGELLTYQGDPTQQGVYFLAHGTLHGRVKRPASKIQPMPGMPPGIVRGINGRPVTRKSVGENNTILQNVYEAPACYGEMSLLTQEPRAESVRAATKCYVWVLDRGTFFRLLNGLTPVQRAFVSEVAYVQRRENIRRVFPLTGSVLSKVHLFSHVPVDRLDALAPRAEPRVYQEGSVICNIGDPSVDMFFVVRGLVSVAVVTSDDQQQHQHDELGQSLNSDGAVAAPAAEATCGPGSVVGEMSVLFAEKRNCRLVALTTVDAFAITKDMITQSITNTSHMSLLLQKAHAIQAQRQRHAKGRFLEYIARIPLVSQIAPEGMHAALLDVFSSGVYAPRATVISVSECADRVVILTRGRARLTTADRDMLLGECVGFTCIVPHRWQYHVVAVDTVETIELGYSAFAEVAKRFGVLNRLRDLVNGLLYPRVFPTAFQEALGMIRGLPGPPSYPCSSAYQIHPFAARVTTVPAIAPALVQRQARSGAGLSVFAKQAAGASNYVGLPMLTNNGANKGGGGGDTSSGLLSDDEGAGGGGDLAANQQQSLVAERSMRRRSVANDGGGEEGSMQRSRRHTTTTVVGRTSPGGPSPTKSPSVASVSSNHHHHHLSPGATMTPAMTAKAKRATQIQKLQEKLQALQSSGPLPQARSPSQASNSSASHVAGSPLRAGKSLRRSAPESASPTAASPAKDTSTTAATAAAATIRQVATQTTRSYLMTLYKRRHGQHTRVVTVASPDDSDEGAAAADGDATRQHQPNNCGHERKKGKGEDGEAPQPKSARKHLDPSSSSPKPAAAAAVAVVVSGRALLQHVVATGGNRAAVACVAAALSQQPEPQKQRQTTPVAPSTRAVASVVSGRTVLQHLTTGPHAALQSVGEAMRSPPSFGTAQRSATTNAKASAPPPMSALELALSLVSAETHGGIATLVSVMKSTHQPSQRS